MKAIVVREFGRIDALDYAEIANPVAGHGEIVIDVAYCGVNFPDSLMAQGKYQLRPELPFVLGSEVSGSIAAIGQGVGGFSIGDRVAALVPFGGYSEQARVQANRALKIPDAVSLKDAAALVVGYGTSHYALKQKAGLLAGETLCVLGAAGLTGLAAVELGRAIGARVIAVASSPEKREAARRAGADVVLGYENLKEELKRATEGKGVDVGFDPVGGESFEELARAMAVDGRLLVIGFASGTIPKLAMNLPLVKEFAIIGLTWGNWVDRAPDSYAENMRELFGWCAASKLKPHVDRIFPLASASDALTHILSRGAVGKVLLAT